MIGGGVVGVCTAYFLAAAGHEVVVVERHHNVAQESSFANAGMTAPGAATPWAAPGAPRKIMSSLFKSEAPVLLRPTIDRALWRWIRKWLAECEPERYRVNCMRMNRIASYSHALLIQLREHHQLEYEQTKGVLQLFRSDEDLQMAAPLRELLGENGISHRIMDADAVREIEPALGYRAEFAGAMYLPDDEAGNCPLFTKHMKRIAKSLGVHFHFTSTVQAIMPGNGGVTLRIDDSEFAADAVVVAAGVESARLLKPLGIRFPLYPVKSYTATAAIKDFDEAPKASLTDESYNVTLTRMGNRIRIAGTAELGSHDAELHQTALRTLVRVASDWFPNAANYNTSTFRSGSRPMLPDGPPLLGATPVPNVYINIGHGSTGWAMAAGSGKVLADIISGRAPDIDMDGLTLSRYG